MRNKIANLKTYFNRLIRGNERGVALIFTLGILGLLMVIALAFASTSMVDRKVAANVNNNQVAKLLAKSALERIEAGLNAHVTVDPSYLVSHDTNASTRSYDWLWKMETTDSDVTYTLPSGTPADSAYPTWQYVLAYKNSTDSEIVGRFAYAVVPNNGKLDPTAVADTDAASVPRPGVSVTEIDIENIDSAFSAKDQVWGDTLLDTLGANGRWSDLSQLAKAVSADISKVSSYFQIRTTPDPESFWFDIDKGDDVDTGEAFHRFNMVRTDWNTVAIGTICPSAVADSEIAKQYTKTLADSNDTGGIPWFKKWSDTGGTSDVAGTFASIADKKNQIAANFIQYSSPETRAVISDVAPSSWLTSEPAYTGLKRTPYINEIGADVTLDATVNPTGGDILLGTASFDVIFKATVRLGGELIYMYGSTVPAAYQNMYLYISGDVYITPKVNGTTYGESSAAVNSSNKALKFSFLSGAYSNSDFTPTDFTVPSSGISDGPNVGNIITVTTVTLNNQSAVPTVDGASGRLVIKRAVLGTASENVDYAKINKTATFGFHNTPYSYSFACEVNDPRQNLNSGDWTASSVNANSAYPATYPGTKNAWNNSVANASNSNPLVDKDFETASDPAYINVGAGQHVSTAYIRHAAMKSPWEIGAIHRGAAWQTLNLNKHASRSAANALIGGGAYADGDANLLDQVKFTSDTEVYGKVNANTSIDEVLNALFAKLPYRGGDVSSTESKYENPGTGSSYSQVSAGSSFETLRGTTVYKKRTEFINGSSAAFMTALYTNTSGSALPQDTDAQKEQLVGKFINLTKAEPLMKDELAVVILAQSIKEAQAGVVIYKDWNNNGNLASTARSTDTNTGKFNSGYRRYNGTDFNPLALTCDIKEYYTPDKKIKLCRYENGADQITGECKMIVVYARDTVTGKWKMKRVRYVE